MDFFYKPQRKVKQGMSLDTCQRIDRGPYERDFVDNILRCRYDWGSSLSGDNPNGSPCRMLQAKKEQSLTVIPLNEQFGKLTYTEGGSEKKLGDLLANVYMAPLIDPYRAAEKNLSTRDAINLKSCDKPNHCRDQTGEFMNICLKDSARCPVDAQQKLLKCAKNSNTSECLEGLLGQSVADCTNSSAEATCMGPTCRWDSANILDEKSGGLVTRGCIAANPVDVCYNVLVENQMCVDDTFLRQYVSDSRSGKLQERKEEVERLASRTCEINGEASATNYIRIQTRAPHGISENGTKVLLKGLGNDGVRSVFVVDEFTLTYLRKPGDEEIPFASRDARLYVPYENSTAMVEYTRGKNGRPRKKDSACVKRESRDQCGKMLAAFKRRYTMLPNACKQDTVMCYDPKARQLGVGYAEWDNPTQCNFKGGAAPVASFQQIQCSSQRQCPSENAECCTQNLSEDECKKANGAWKVGKCCTVGRNTLSDARCFLQQVVPCGYRRVNAGVGPDPEHGVYHNTTVETLRDPVKIAHNALCMVKSKTTESLKTESDTLGACAAACAEHLNCKYFAYGKGAQEGDCLLQSMDTDDCVSGWYEGDYDTFTLKTETNLVGCSRFGSMCCPESHVRGIENNGITCATQMPTDDGAFRLTMAGKTKDGAGWRFTLPDELGYMKYCVPEQVEVLKHNQKLQDAATESANTFSDMRDKNSEVSKVFENEKILRHALNEGCCNEDGSVCGCPFIPDYPVYFPAYHDEVLRSQESNALADKPKPKPVGLGVSIAGCDTWDRLEKDLNLDVDVKFDMDGNPIPRISMRQACEQGWKTRDCNGDRMGNTDFRTDNFEVNDAEDRQDDRLRLSACRSGIALRALNAPIDYQREFILRTATQQEHEKVRNLTRVCNPKPTNHDDFCSGAGSQDTKTPANTCVSDGRGSTRCQQCTNDMQCQTQFGSDEFGCRPYIDVKREIIYDNDIDSNEFTRHGYKFKTCQRVDLHEENLYVVDRMAFAENQRYFKGRMEEAHAKSKATTGVMVSLLVAVLISTGVYLFLRNRDII